MPADGDEYRLKWQTHIPSLCTEFLELRKNESLVDVTLICKGGSARGHRLLLSSCSPLLEGLLASNAEQEATLLLPDVPVSCVRSLLEYIYTGEINVHDSEIDGLVEVANLLEIRGIAGSVSSGGNMKRPRPASLPIPINFPFPSPLPASIPSPQYLPSPHHLLTSPMPSPLGMRSPVLNSPTKSLLRKNLTAGIPDKRKSPAKRSTSNENLAKRKSPSIEDLSTKKEQKEDDKGMVKKKLKNEVLEEGQLIRCSTPLFVDTKSPEEACRPNRSNSDRSDASDSQRVTTTSQEVADDTVSSLNSSLISEAETSLLNPQVELSEGVGRITIKPEFSYSTSPLASPALQISTSPPPAQLADALDAKSGACVFCKKHFVSADDLKDHISRIHMSDNRMEKQFKCDYCPAAFARSAHLKRHVRTHTGERPYACTVCPRAFSRQDKLKCHMDRHTEEERRKLQAATSDSSSVLPTSSPASMQSYINSINRSLQLASPSAPLPASISAAEALYGSALSTTNVGNHSNSASSPASSNPGMPYLQNILDEVQIVRDKKPPSYYRHIKKSDAYVSGLRKLGDSPLKMATTAE